MVEIGDLAPDFSLRDQAKQPVTLSDFRGQKNVVLLFYPFSFTNVCKGELCAIRDELADFSNDDVVTLAVSVDSPQVHAAWAADQGYDFPMLADFWPHGAVAQAYGVFHEQAGAAIRGTFIIDKQGVVVWKVVHEIPDARDHDEYKKVLASLG